MPTTRARVRLFTAALLSLALLLSLGGTALAAPPPGVLERVIVVLRDNVGNPEVVADEVTQRHNGRKGFVYENALKGFSAELPAQAVAALARDSRVAYVERDQEVFAFAQEMPTGVNRMEADKNATAKINGVDERVNVDIAILDTGIAAHPDLDIAGGVNCTGGGPFSSRCKTGGYADGNDHGTHVAGTAAAIDNGSGVVGVAPGARLWAVKVLSDRGSGYTSWIIAGIDWVTSEAARIEVANMSLGCECYSKAQDDAITRSTNAGVVYVVAAGNSGKDALTFSPANHPQVIAVSAVADFNGKAGGGAGWTCRDDVDDTLADFSNYGATVDIAAPGVCINSTVPGGGYAQFSGTSMASPHGAGAAALYIVQNNVAKTETRWSDVLSGLQGNGWSVPQDNTCGFTAGKSGERFLMLGVCD